MMDMTAHSVWTDSLGPGTASLAVSNLGARRSREWVHHVITLLDAAVSELSDQEQAAQCTILRATSLLRQQIDPPARQEAPDGTGRLLAWQARKVRDYIDSHITGPVRVADLGALVQLSGAHFSRCFRRSFGQSPHAFVVRRRVELAARHMLETNASLSDIALRCGFADQAHLCNHFRQATGQTPAAWRRARRTRDTGSPESTEWAVAPRPATGDRGAGEPWQSHEFGFRTTTLSGRAALMEGHPFGFQAADLHESRRGGGGGYGSR
jgi:AraC-like DNA-binding protein